MGPFAVRCVECGVESDRFGFWVTGGVVGLLCVLCLDAFLAEWDEAADDTAGRR